MLTTQTQLVRDLYTSNQTSKMLHLRPVLLSLISGVSLGLSAPAAPARPTPTTAPDPHIGRRALSTYTSWSDIVLVSTNTQVQVISHVKLGTGERDRTDVVAPTFTNQDGVVTTMIETGIFTYIQSLSMEMKTAFIPSTETTSTMVTVVTSVPDVVSKESLISRKTN